MLTDGGRGRKIQKLSQVTPRKSQLTFFTRLKSKKFQIIYYFLFYRRTNHGLQINVAETKFRIVHKERPSFNIAEAKISVKDRALERVQKYP